MFSSRFLAFAFCLVAVNAVAKPTFEKTENCASAKVVSGETCSKVQVQFDFSKCPGKNESQTVGWYQCSGQTLTARATIPGYRFQAKFKKQDDGWGAVVWEGPSQFTAWKHSGETEKNNVAQTPKAPPTPVLLPVTTATPPEAPTPRVPAAEPDLGAFKVSSFLDFRSKTTIINKLQDKTESGFLVEESALYVEYKKDKLTFFVDLPFARNTDTATNTADFSFAKTKAQVFATYAMNDQFSLTFGQFDTLFGIELNDSKDRVFGQTGLVYNQTLPVVHSGADLQFTHNEIVAKLLAANPSDREALGGAGTNGDENHEMGATLGYNWDLLHGQLGYLTRSMKDRADGNSARNLLNVILGTKYSAFTLDVEYSMVTNPQKNTLTTNGTDKEDAGTGIMALATYSPFEKWLVGLRYETINKDPGASGYYKASTYGVALHHDVTENLQARAEYYSIKVPTDPLNTKSDEERYYIGGLLHF